MEDRIGKYEGERRILPKLTLSGKPVKKPVMNTRDIGNNQFVVLDMFPGKRFDIEAEIAKLTGFTPDQPAIGEQIIDVGVPMTPHVFGSFESDTPQGDSGVKRSR